MIITLDQKQIKVIIQRKKIKNLYFKFDHELNLIVSCHKRYSDQEIIKIINSNEEALTKLYFKAEKQNTNQGRFYYLGKHYTIVVNEAVKEVYFDDDLIWTKNHKMLDKFYLAECRRVFEERINYLMTKFLDVPAFNLKIRKMQTRWGVCHRIKKTITLNSELLKKEIDLIDYVIVHELCHFYEGNHRPSFWLEVAKRYPEYKQARKKLKEV